MCSTQKQVVVLTSFGSNFHLFKLLSFFFQLEHESAFISRLHWELEHWKWLWWWSRISPSLYFLLLLSPFSRRNRRKHTIFWRKRALSNAPPHTRTTIHYQALSLSLPYLLLLPPTTTIILTDASKHTHTRYTVNKAPRTTGTSLAKNRDLQMLINLCSKFFRLFESKIFIKLLYA